MNQTNTVICAIFLYSFYFAKILFQDKIRQFFLCNCTHPQHNNYPIQGFCLNLECKFTSQCCSLCPQDIHKTHRNDCKNSVEVKKMIQNYYNMLCDWKKRLENTQQLEDRARKYIEKQTAIVIELHEKMKVKSLQTLNSQIKRIKLWNSHYTIGSKIANDNLQVIRNDINSKINFSLQKLKNFEDQMMSIDNEFQQYEEEIEQEQFTQQSYEQSEKDHENTPAEKQMLKGFYVAILGLQLLCNSIFFQYINKNFILRQQNALIKQQVQILDMLKPICQKVAKNILKGILYFLIDFTQST